MSHAHANPAVEPTVPPLPEALRRAVSQAALAPSAHNAQPWSFALGDHEVALRADRGRALPVIDPDGRELTMGCGAALFQLRTALRAASLDVDVHRLPDARDPDLLARVAARPGEAPSEVERALAEAIPWRHVVRTPFLGITLPDDVLARLVAAAEAEGAWLALLTRESARLQLIALIMEADHQQWSDPRFRHELARWMRPNDSAARDGLFGFAEGLDNIESRVFPIVSRLLDLGARRALRDRDLAEASPVLAVLGTDGDEPIDWLRAGEALDRVLLQAESEDIAAAFLNQAVEVPELRTRVGELTGRKGWPQAVLRLGYGPDGRPTPRRPVDALIR